jgi:hypothetical protein
MEVHQLNELVKKQCVYVKVIRLVDVASGLDITVKIQDLDGKLDIGPAELGN